MLVSCFIVALSSPGYSADGPGGGSTSGQGGSYGGFGTTVDNGARLYGSIETPDHYGSQGAGASSTTHRGGGYIKIVATESVQIGLNIFRIYRNNFCGRQFMTILYTYV